MQEVNLVYDKKNNDFWLEIFTRCVFFPFITRNKSYWKLNNELTNLITRKDLKERWGTDIYSINKPFNNKCEIIKNNPNEKIEINETVKKSNNYVEITNIVESRNLTEQEKINGFIQNGSTFCKIKKKKIKNEDEFEKVLRFILIRNNKTFCNFIDLPLNIRIKE